MTSVLTLDSKISILTAALDSRGRGRPDVRRPGPPGLFPAIDAPELSRWNRTIESTDIRQMAVSVDNDSTVVVHNVDRRLRGLGLMRGGVLYDFSGADSVSIQGHGGVRGETERERGVEGRENEE